MHDRRQVCGLGLAAVSMVAAAGKASGQPIEVTSRAVIRWTADGWRISAESRTRDTGPGLHVADLQTQHIKVSEAIEWTFFWPAVDRWEGANDVVNRI